MILSILLKGPGCPSGYDAGLTNQTPLVRFPWVYFLITAEIITARINLRMNNYSNLCTAVMYNIFFPMATVTL